MKIRISKKVLDEMDPRVREIVQEWRIRHHRAFIEVESCSSFYSPEDAHVKMINLFTGAQQIEQAAGEFAGFTRLSPSSAIPLPIGVVAVVEYFFIGDPQLAIYQGTSRPSLTSS